MKKTIYLHIGRGKTGTTQIQHFLSHARPRLRERGLHYLEAEDLRNPGAGHQQFAKSFISELPETMIPASEPEQRRSAVFDELRSVDAPSYLISSENLPLADIDELHSFFAELGSNYQVKVVAFVRSQDELAESEYNQAVKLKRLTGTLRDYAYEKLEDCNYFEFAQAWEQRFDEGNIICRVYDGSKKDVVRQFLSCIGGLEDINPDADQPEWNTSTAANTSIGIKALIAARILNEIELEGRANLYAQIFRELEGNDLPALLFSVEEAKRFREAFWESNMAFNERYLGHPDREIGGRRYSDAERARILSLIDRLAFTSINLLRES